MRAKIASAAASKRRAPNEPSTLAAPALGTGKRGRAYAQRLEAPLALVDKRRTRADDMEVMPLIGDVKGRNVVIFDDVVSTGKFIAKAAIALKEQGAEEIYVGVTHAVFSPEAGEIMRSAPVREIVVTDSIAPRSVGLDDRLKVLSVSRLFGEAIRRIHEERSLSSLFV